MSRNTHNRRRKPRANAPIAEPLPDTSPSRPRWKYAVLVAAFLAWVAFLVYCGLAGTP